MRPPTPAADPAPQQADDQPRVSLWPSLLAVAALATLPYLSLAAANTGQALDLAVVGRWWLVTLAAALAVVGGVARWRRPVAPRVAVVVATGLYLVFNHPLVLAARDALGIPLVDLAWWGLVTAAGLAAAVVLGRHHVVQQFVAVVAPLLLLAPLAQLATAPSPEAVPTATAGGDLPVLEHTPNVYWFVLDGLAAVPYLRDEVGVDTAPLVAALEAEGFDVLEGSHTNYPFTHLAVASALEQEYLYDGVDEPSPAPFYPVLQGDSRTVDTFVANGYGYVHAYPGLWSGSRCGGREDACLGAHGPLTDTETALLAATPLLDLVVDPRAHASIAAANDPAAVVERVLAAPVADPTFAFIHLLNPHPPYLRGATCELREVPLDFAAWGQGPEYRDATTCLFARLAVAVDAILAVDDDPVIIISGDHGPRLGLSGETEGEVLLDGEMFLSAFNAIRLPDACADTGVPGDMTLVNTFRVVVACLTDQPPDLLEDRQFPIRRDYG